MLIHLVDDLSLGHFLVFYSSHSVYCFKWHSVSAPANPLCIFQLLFFFYSDAEFLLNLEPRAARVHQFFDKIRWKESKWMEKKVRNSQVKATNLREENKTPSRRQRMWGGEPEKWERKRKSVSIVDCFCCCCPLLLLLRFTNIHTTANDGNWITNYTHFLSYIVCTEHSTLCQPCPVYLSFVIYGIVFTYFQLKMKEKHTTRTTTMLLFVIVAIWNALFHSLALF